MNDKLLNDLAGAAWSVLNFDNDPKTEPEGPANWKALKEALAKVLRKHTEKPHEHTPHHNSILAPSTTGIRVHPTRVATGGGDARS